MIKKLARIIELIIVTIILLSWLFSSRCIAVGALRAVVTPAGISCRFLEGNVTRYAPLKILENPPSPILFFDDTSNL
jgi:hypothetical protein